MDDSKIKYNIPSERFGSPDVRGMNIWAFESHIWELDDTNKNLLVCPWCGISFDLKSNDDIEVDGLCEGNPYVIQISDEIYKEIYSELRKKLKDPKKFELFMDGFPLIV